MNDTYHAIYNELCDRYRGEDKRRLKRVAADIVEEAVKETRLTTGLRPDSRLFLLVCLHQTLLRPLSHHDSEVGGLESVVALLREDSVEILGLAAKKHASSQEKDAEDDDDGITVLHVIEAIAELWSSLKFNMINAWS